MPQPSEDQSTFPRLLSGLGEVPTWGEQLDTIGQRWDQYGVLALLLVEASVLDAVEQRHGGAGRSDVLEALTSLIQQVGETRLTVDDLVLWGEPGRNEILVLVFRELGSADFYRREFPAFERAFGHALEKHERLFYPYCRTTPEVGCGTSVAIRNPKLTLESQFLGLIREAGVDVAHRRSLSHHELRRQFTDILLERSVYSVYEPIVHVNERTVFGYEALIRGPVESTLHTAPALFSAAGEFDLVFELDCLCRASGLRGAVDLPEGTKLFLNLLPAAIHDPDFQPDRLIETLESCRLEPSDLILEISEKEAIEDLDLFRELTDGYRRLGFQLALDDTGAGYAGFQELIELKPDFIKMDRSVISGVDQDPLRQEVLSALLSIANNMGARVIGEGLDTLQELEMLAELGIQFGQGWLFGRPMPLSVSRLPA